MGYTLDIIEEGAGGAIFDRVPFLVSFDAAGRFPVDSCPVGPEIPAGPASMQCSRRPVASGIVVAPTVYTATTPEEAGRARIS